MESMHIPGISRISHFIFFCQGSTTSDFQSIVANIFFRMLDDLICGSVVCSMRVPCLMKDVDNNAVFEDTAQYDTNLLQYINAESFIYKEVNLQ